MISSHLTSHRIIPRPGLEPVVQPLLGLDYSLVSLFIKDHLFTYHYHYYYYHYVSYIIS